MDLTLSDEQRLPAWKCRPLRRANV